MGHRLGTLTADFLLFVVTLIIVVIIMSTAFGKGVVAQAMGLFGLSQPAYLAKEFSTFATAAAFMPGSLEVSGIKMTLPRDLEITNAQKIYVEDTASHKSCTIPYLKPSNVVPNLNRVSADPGKNVWMNKIWNGTNWELQLEERGK